MRIRNDFLSSITLNPKCRYKIKLEGIGIRFWSKACHHLMRPPKEVKD